jgi:hypothetical protein
MQYATITDSANLCDERARNPGTVLTGRAQAAGIPEAATGAPAARRPPLFPSAGPPCHPVVTLNGWMLPFRMNGDWKEFRPVAEPATKWSGGRCRRTMAISHSRSASSRRAGKN